VRRGGGSRGRVVDQSPAGGEGVGAHAAAA
jgi:hypothetical protein